jgi:hypothetical protein
MKLSFSTTGGSSSKGPSAMGKGCGTLFFGVFFAMGMLFVVLILGEALKQLEPWWWPEVPCTVVASSVEESDDEESPYSASVRYRYEFEGREHQGSRVSRGEGGTASYDSARNTALRYPAGAAATCRVDPDHPKLSVLERRVPWIVFLVFFPLIFVAVGAGGLWFSWRSRPPGENGEVQSISQRAGVGGGHRLGLVLGLIFVVVGGVVFAFLFAVPAFRTFSAAGWQATPCAVVRSTVRSWSTDDGTSFRPDVLYEYSAGGRSWRSNRVTFFSALSSGADRSRSIRDRYPGGASTTCWVDPDDPSRSVLDRKIEAFHLLGLLPLLFVIVGAAVASWSRKQLRAQPVPGKSAPETVEPADVAVHLKPQVSPVGKVLGTLFFALFWNGIVSIFVWQAWKTWQAGDPDWFLTLFMVPFVLVGLAACGAVGYMALALANPRPRITLASGRIRLGDPLRIDWRFTGQSCRLSHLRIFIEGREEATYRRGTDTHTDREVFATFDLIDTANDWEIPRGSAEIAVPDDTMHSFAAPSNKIVWEIKVEGEIDRWPDVNQNFPIQILPLRIEAL